MSEPFARPMPPAPDETATPRAPRAFAAETAEAGDTIVALSDSAPVEEPIARPPKLLGWLGRIVWVTGGLLVSLALGLATERLIADLFATQPWLGWAALALAVLLAMALVLIIIREMVGLARLRALETLRRQAVEALNSDAPRAGKAVTAELLQLYTARPDLARARNAVTAGEAQIFDGSEHIRHAERLLLAPLDARARRLTAASARRVALVTAVSPRALVDIAFVVFESVRLGGDIARLYGARPGFLGTWKLLGAILAHLAVTGGLVLTDGVVEQLVGQGVAAKLSARLGEGVVNGLMTVRVGIAAIRVVRPLPFAALPQPVVKDFIPELANVLNAEGRT